VQRLISTEDVAWITVSVCTPTCHQCSGCTRLVDHLRDSDLRLELETGAFERVAGRKEQERRGIPVCLSVCRLPLSALFSLLSAVHRQSPRRTL
jgi:hypothetical protein